MRFWNSTKWTPLCYFLPAGVLAGLTAVSLHGYTEPVFTVEQMDTNVASAAQTTASDAEKSGKSTTVTTKAALLSSRCQRYLMGIGMALIQGQERFFLVPLQYKL